MIKPIPDLTDLIQEACNCNNPTGPEYLLSVHLKKPNPFCKNNEDQLKRLQEAAQKDFATIYNHDSSCFISNKVYHKKWVDQLAWLFQAMESFNSTCSSMPNKLFAILLTANAFRKIGLTWDTIPKNYFTRNFIHHIAKLLACIQYTFDSNGQEVPIWEREAVDDFMKADADCNWEAIESSWNIITPVIIPNRLFDEIVGCLNATEFGQKSLAVELDKINIILAIVEASNAMNNYQIATVATLCTSNRARFALIKSLVYNQPNNEPFKKDITDKLASIFRSIQTDHYEWEKWMQALNKYPVRTALLQPAFGKSLVNSTKEAKSAYLNAIELNTSDDECREAVSICFETFKQKAELFERQMMWQLSYMRWKAWNFDLTNKEKILTTSAVCSLDYAVIGYYVENLSEDELYQAQQSAAVTSSTFQNRWYKDHQTYNTAWLCALSKWQIIVYANRVRKGEKPWAWPLSTYRFLPFDPKTNRYAGMSLKIAMPHNF